MREEETFCNLRHLLITKKPFLPYVVKKLLATFLDLQLTLNDTFIIKSKVAY